MAEKKPKNIHLTPDCIKTLSIKAIENNMVFKTYVEKILEELAKSESKKRK